MLNQEKCYEYEELNYDLLKGFAEGSKNLEELLINCYENKIVTQACCIGHDEKKLMKILQVQDHIYCLLYQKKIIN